MSDESPHAGNRAAVFCTAYVTEENVKRYQSWIDYYSAVLPGVDLHLFNDGPMQGQLDFKGTVSDFSFIDRLGRPSSWAHAGWRRSVAFAVRVLSHNYDHIGMIDSDCTITPQSIAKYKKWLFSPNYAGAYCERYHFAETSCQVINTEAARQWYAGWDDFYADDEPIERRIDRDMKPDYVFSGVRWERGEPFNPHLDYVAQCPPYRFFELLFNPENAPDED